MTLTGAKILMECLLEQNVDTIFGYPGGTILNVYDALYDYSDRITHYLTSHEQGASHAADGYARSTGKTGVCFATSGPGCTNLTTGIATAYYDSSPMVCITCNVTESVLGLDAFQEVDITGITMPITKSNYMVTDVNKLADVVREAFFIAQHGRPGPVLIDILKNVTAETAEFTPLPQKEHTKHGHLAKLYERPTYKEPALDRKEIELACKMISESQRPMIICGGGVVRGRAEKELTMLSNTIDAPTASTIMGLGGFDSTNPRFTGILGMHGSRASNLASKRCDLMIAVGCRFSDRVACSTADFAKDAKVIHIDIDPSEINKNIICDLGIVGDAREILALLCASAEPRKNPEWTAEIEGYKAAPSLTGELTPVDIIHKVDELTEDDAIIVTDVGQHQMWTAQHYKYRKPGQLITSGGFGTMGFGLGAALGSKVGNPDRTVVHITGDGCFRMNCHELATEEHYSIPVITIIFNNGTLGMVRQWQTLMYNKRYSQTTLDRGPDFVKLAEAYGIKGYRAYTLDEFTGAFNEALASGAGAVIDCQFDIDAKVNPMVAGGNPLDKFLLE